MKKIFGWMFATMTCLTLVSAFADSADEVTNSDSDDQVAIVVEEEASE